jgi:YARHG domain
MTNLESDEFSVVSNLLLTRIAGGTRRNSRFAKPSVRFSRGFLEFRNHREIRGHPRSHVKHRDFSFGIRDGRDFRSEDAGGVPTMIRVLMALGLICLWTSAATAQSCCRAVVSTDGQTVVYVAGEIVEGDDVRFAAFLRAHPDTAAVGLNSPGGAVVPALAIGRLIRRHHLDTSTGYEQLCASACALIWLAGENRIAWAKSSIGFHAASNIVTGREGLGSALVGKYLGELGFSDDAIMWMHQQDAAHLNFLNPAVAQRLGIDMVVVGADRQVTKRIANGHISMPVGESTELARPSEPSNESTLPNTCDRLWAARNWIFKQAGYCFSTPLAIRAFGNEGCHYARQEDVPLSGDARARIAQIRLAETANGCK